jgi:hypothetical protein
MHSDISSIRALRCPSGNIDKSIIHSHLSAIQAPIPDFNKAVFIINLALFGYGTHGISTAYRAFLGSHLTIISIDTIYNFYNEKKGLMFPDY